MVKAGEVANLRNKLQKLEQEVNEKDKQIHKLVASQGSKPGRDVQRRVSGPRGSSR